jgi:hypothetical protein
MLNPKDYSFCNEFYIVEKSVEVVVTLGGEARRVRIDALRDHAGKYSTHSYIKDEIKAHLTYRREHDEDGQKSVGLWLDYDLPWTDRSSADEALSQALHFLSERCPK